MPEYRLEIVNRQAGIVRAAESLSAAGTFALDIETAEWWNRQREKIALIQFAFRSKSEIKVVIVDPLANCDITPLRAPLESAQSIKVIHNAAFDAVKLFNHYRIETAPIFDTMIAARQGGEKKYSLRSQAATHLNIHLNKETQRSDWSRRPLDLKQLDYAARDAYATLLLYEHQAERKLAGSYFLRSNRTAPQILLPLEEAELGRPAADTQFPMIATEAEVQIVDQIDLQPSGRAILGIVSELPGRYGPEQLAVSVGVERVGLAGWIIDRFLGRESDLDEETAKLAIGHLCERRLLRVNDWRRLEATDEGTQLWQKIK
jgi:hypothetical protein